MGSPLRLPERAVYERAAARAALGASAFAAAWEAGRALALPAAVAEAQAVAREIADASPAAVPSRPLPAGLTPREAEVLRLLAARLTDREIAEALFISPKTAGFHVANILGKLGVANRREAAALAAREGLA